MAKTKATLLSMEDAGPPPETQEPPEKPWDQMSAEEQRAAFVRKVMAQRAEEEKAKELPPPPPLSERQRKQIEAEMAHGREVAARHAANLEAQRGPRVERDPSEGFNTPVFRPDDYVPNMNQGKNASASSRSQNL